MARLIPLFYFIIRCTELLATACPCSDVKLCLPVQEKPDKEVVGFMTRTSNWKKYNWTQLTTIALFTDMNKTDLMEFICYAHQHKVRVVTNIRSDVLSVHNDSGRQEFVKKLLDKVRDNYFDGINIDVESPLSSKSSEIESMTDTVKEIYHQFKKSNNNYQITFDVAWSPNCIDDRCYDYKSLSEWTDFLIVMAYDERSQIFTGPCIGGPNSDIIMTQTGITAYEHLEILPKNLVLGLPWYGYDYTCIALNNNVCAIKKVPFRGAPCSDAAGKQIGYADIMVRYLPKSANGRQYNSTVESPFFTYQADDGKYHQIWYDDPRSLSIKYKYAKDMELHGLAFWEIDTLYGGAIMSDDRITEMWTAIDTFLK